MNLKAGQLAFDSLDFKEYIEDWQTPHFTQNKATWASKIAKGVDPLLELKRSPSYLCVWQNPWTTSALCGTWWMSVQPLYWRIYNLNCTALTWIPFQAILIPDTSLSTAIRCVLSFPSHQRTLVWLSGQISMVSRRFYKTRPRVHHHHVWPSNLSGGYGSSKEEPQEACRLILRMDGFHITHYFLGAIGYLMQATGIDDSMVAAEVCLRGRAHMVIFGKYYYAMLHVNTMVHASMSTIHWEALVGWFINKEHDLEYMSMHAWFQCPRFPVRKECREDFWMR